MVVQELMQGGLLGASLPQPVEDCLNVVGRMLCGGPGHGAVMSSTWQPMDVLKKSTSGGTKVPSLPPSGSLTPAPKPLTLRNGTSS